MMDLKAGVVMAPPKKIKGNAATLTIRADEEVLRVAGAIASIKRETVSDVIRNFLQEYVDENIGILGSTFTKMGNKD
jgi:hypothetical protein